MNAAYEARWRVEVGQVDDGGELARRPALRAGHQSGAV